jgi:hypothetical protein
LQEKWRKLLMFLYHGSTDPYAFYTQENPNVTSSDVIAFIMVQPDFHDFSATKEMKHVG